MPPGHHLQRECSSLARLLSPPSAATLSLKARITFTTVRIPVHLVLIQQFVEYQSCT